MIDWTARARARLAEDRTGGTDRTDESRVLSVSSVTLAAKSVVRAGLSSVSSAPIECVPAAARRSGNPYLTPAQGDDCHAGGWSDAEIAAFLSRAARFNRQGRPDAEHLAERLILRDRQVDDRRMCMECRELEPSGRCGAARRGAIDGADPRMEPVPDILMRCEGFRPCASNDRAHGVNEYDEDDQSI